MIAHTVHKRPRPFALPIALAVGLATSLLPVGASAALPDASSDAAPSDTAATGAAQSCWEDVDTGATGCFDSSLEVQEQIELVTGNPVVAVETGTSGERRFTPTSTSSTAAVAATYLLLTGWDDITMSGASKSYFSSNAIICDGGGYGFFDLGTFSDRFESIQSYNGCNTILYDGTDFEGAYTAYLTTSADLGTFKNRASSLEID